MRTHDPKFLNEYLFICKANIARSATAEHVARSMGYRADSAGWLDVITVRPVTQDQLDHARQVVCMEESVAKEVRKQFPNTQLVVWNIPDVFKYCDPQLMTIIRAKLPPR
jgi:predicted protein tyrosine phosphatase